MNNVEDAYAYYVLITGISEDFFWNAEYSEFITSVLDKVAYDNWLAYQQEKRSERR